MNFSSVFLSLVCTTIHVSCGDYFDVKDVKGIMSSDNPEQTKGLHSRIECVMICQRKTPLKNAFYTTDKKCYCVSESADQANHEIAGELISKVS